MSEQHHHIVPIKMILTVGAILVFLTILTVFIGYLHLPNPYNVIAGIGIAVIKASLVVMFFMNLYWERRRFNIMVFLAGIVFLTVFVGITLLDTLHRAHITPGF
ncbi:MAG TPA: cytochrome C oxidase subunit IV family protein [Balneolales bacterium]|nr:cytochrome C oxidase subunit IV family protein [Balneolales bacterium]